MPIFSSMRIRATVSFVVVFALIMAVIDVAILGIRREQAETDFDKCLLAQSKSLAEVIELASDGTISWHDGATVSKYARAFRCAEFYHNIKLPDGTVVDSSGNLSDLVLSKELPSLATLKRTSYVFENTSGDTVDRILGEGSTMRIVSYYHVTKSGQVLIIQVGMDLDPLHAGIEKMQASVIAFSCFSLLAVALTSWLLASRLVRPMKQMAQQVGEITPRDLDQEIELSDKDSEASEMADTINQLLHRLHEAFRAQREFLQHSAHELRTPISVLLGEAQVLRSKPRDLAEYERYLENIDGELKSVSKVIDSMLMLANVRAGTHPRESEQVSVNNVIIDVLELAQPVASQKRIKLKPKLGIMPDTDQEPMVEGDPQLLATMFSNLVRNAIRFSDIGSDIDIVIEGKDERVDICVADSGPGIPEEKLGEIFDPYVSIPRAGRTSGSSGIGLTIARSIVLLHGGTIAAKNREPHGAEFCVTLPMADEPSDDAARDG